MDGEEFFATLNERLTANPALLAHAGVYAKTVSLELEDVGKWAIIFQANGDASVFFSRAAGGGPEPDCAIEMSEKTFAKLIAGDLNVPWAVVTRKIKIYGEKDLAERVGKALQSAV